MRILDLQHYLEASLAKWGNIECFIDVDPQDEDLYEIDSVFADLDAEDPTAPPLLVFACYETKAKLEIVK